MKMTTETPSTMNQEDSHRGRSGGERHHARDLRDTAPSSDTGGVKANGDGSVDLTSDRRAQWAKSNRFQTVPGKGWFILLRLCGALERWFDKTWRPGEISLVQ
jgi:hypothetical protein